MVENNIPNLLNLRKRINFVNTTLQNTRMLISFYFLNISDSHIQYLIYNSKFSLAKLLKAGHIPFKNVLYATKIKFYHEALSLSQI